MAQTAPTLVRVITWLPVGGIERRLVAVLPRLRDRGWNARLVCVREKGPLAAELLAQGIPVEVIHFKSRFSPSALRRLAAYLREHETKIVHSHMYRSNAPATVAAGMADVPAMFAQIHNVDSWDGWRQCAVDRILASHRTGTIAVSRAVQQDVMAKLKLPEAKVPILYNGINVEEFRPDPEAGAALRRELGVAADRVVFLVPARLHPQKNPLGVAKAFFSAVGKMGNTPAPLLVFAGGGKMEGELRALLSGSPAAENVIMLGERSDMAALYNMADAALLSSFREGFSNAVVEALGCGKPVIASDVGGNREALDSARVGWLHAAGDGDALTSQLIEAAWEGREGLAARSADCRARAMHFSIEALVQQTHELYVKALGHEP
ncbi:glycosyltransferase [soil metagenome]